MSEAIISRRGISSNQSYAYESTIETFVSNTAWKVPRARDNQFYVRIFGGGGGSTDQQTYPIGGGGGWMNNGSVELTENSIVQITIGKGGSSNGGINAVAGGTTSFGTYLSANGGDSRFGNGGSGGGYFTGFPTVQYNFNNRQYYLYQSAISELQSIGYQFGGGGCAGSDVMYNTKNNKICGGGGGIWGGGGGKTVMITNTSRTYNAIFIPKNNSTSMGYGGNGGVQGSISTVNGVSGTNTIGDVNVATELQGPGLFGIGYWSSSYGASGGGGGGYGGNGGYGCIETNVDYVDGRFQFTSSNNQTVTITMKVNTYHHGGGGGGGGYGSDGGNGSILGCGGGGGYGKSGKGGDAYMNISGGGGGYGPGGSYWTSPGYAGGGAGGQNGGDGICIVQYYKRIDS